jgi:hypothetical protein
VLAPAALLVSPAPADATAPPHAVPVAQAGSAQDAPVAVPERPRDAEPPSAPPRNEAAPQRPVAGDPVAAQRTAAGDPVPAQRSVTGDPVPAHRPPIASPLRSSASSSAGKAAPAAAPPDSIRALFDAKNYARVVRACSDTTPTAAIASLCVRAACNAGEGEKAQRWLPLLSPAESPDTVVDYCKRLGVPLTRRPSLDCLNDPLDCR